MASADTVWRCEGGEALALIDNGRTLFVASQDYFLTGSQTVGSDTVFSYQRDSDGITDDMALDATGVHATFLVCVHHLEGQAVVGGHWSRRAESTSFGPTDPGSR